METNVKQSVPKISTFRKGVLAAAFFVLGACTAQEEAPKLAPLNEPVEQLEISRDIIRKGERGGRPPRIIREIYLLRCEASKPINITTLGNSYVAQLNETAGRVTTNFRVAPTRSNYVFRTNQITRTTLGCIGLYQSNEIVGSGNDEVLRFAATNGLFAELAASQ